MFDHRHLMWWWRKLQTICHTRIRLCLTTWIWQAGLSLPQVSKYCTASRQWNEYTCCMYRYPCWVTYMHNGTYASYCCEPEQASDLIDINGSCVHVCVCVCVWSILHGLSGWSIMLSYTCSGNNCCNTVSAGASKIHTCNTLQKLHGCFNQ